MNLRTISVASSQQLYNSLASIYDWFSFFEARAKSRAMDLLDPKPGEKLLNVGLGTGKEHLLLQRELVPEGIAFGVDISDRMVRKASRRTHAPLCVGNGGYLPFAAASFDGLLCSYVLDLIPIREIPDWLAGFRRVLKPGGRIVLVSLTEGVNGISKTFVSLWKLAYAISPIICAGCRPLRLEELVQQAGFNQIDWHVIVQLGVPSQVIAAVG